MKSLKITILLLFVTLQLTSQTTKQLTLSNGDGWYRVVRQNSHRANGMMRIWGTSGNNKSTGITLFLSIMAYGQGGSINIVDNLHYNSNHVAEIRAGSSGGYYVVDIKFENINTPTNVSIQTDGQNLQALDVPLFGNLDEPAGLISISGKTVGISSTRWPIFFDQKVGIGTPSPEAELHVEGQYRSIQSSNGDVIGLYISNDNSSNSNSNSIYFASKDTDGERDNGAIIKTLFSEHSTTGVTGNLIFETADNAENPTERLRITGNGNVGIGYNNPQSQVIVGSAFGASISGSSGGNAVFGTNLAIQQGGTNHNKLYTPYSHNNNYGYAGIHARWGDLRFYTSEGNTTQGSVVNPIARMIIEPDGNVGIGTTDPRAKLHIQKSELDNQAGFLIGRYNNPSINLLSVGEHSQAGGVVGAYGGALFHAHNRSIAFSTKNTTFNGIASNDIDLFIKSGDGKVGIGTTNPDAKLTVKGTIHTEEVKVDLSVPGPDYVFEPDYDLRSLEETKEFIKENKHLPEIPSAKEMEANGMDLGDMNLRLLKKIEELTLHQIDLLERIEAQQKQLDAYRSEVKELKKKLN